MCLHYFNVVGNAGGEAIARLCERLRSEIQIALGDGNLIRGGFQIQQRRANAFTSLCVLSGLGGRDGIRSAGGSMR